MSKKATPKKKTGVTPATQAPQDLRTVTVLYVDGNSVAAMAVSATDSGYHVEGIEHLEVDRLLEVVKRLRHPIFMDLNFCLMPEKDLIQQYFRRFLERSVFDHPTVCLLAPEKVWPTSELGADTPDARAARRIHLFSTAMPVNPYEYPAVAVMEETSAPDGRSRTTLQRARLADFVQVAQVTQAIQPRLLGFCSGISAAQCVLEILPNDDPLQEGMLCDIGKLRTLYARRDAQGNLNFNPIPVGLARDDTHYFRSISPEMDKLNRLQASIGNLLFPPEATPSPLFSVTASSPQVDCTRLALQVSRYALRAFTTPRTQKPAEPEPVRYLTGRGSRLPGLREYIEKKTNAEFRRLDRRPLQGVTVANGLRLGDVADNVMLLGAAIDTFRRARAGARLMTSAYKSPPMKNRRCSIPDLEDGISYVFEHGTD